MNYITLPITLHETADRMKRYLSSQMGLAGIKAEEAIEPSIEYRPTLYANTRDFHVVCVDVSETIYNPTRWSFITDCEKSGLPVKFYVALPNCSYSSFAKEFKDAKKMGVGVIEVTNNSSTILHKPLSLSLTGLRQFDKSSFPKKYREAIINAEDSFRNGEPNKACSLVYDEIELLTRKIAFKSHPDWSSLLSDPNTLNGSLAWARVITYLKERLNRGSATKYSGLTDTLLSQIHGITPFRNQSGHKPTNGKTLQTRDGQLRTRMESGIDLLKDLITASKNLKV